MSTDTRDETIIAQARRLVADSREAAVSMGRFDLDPIAGRRPTAALILLAEMVRIVDALRAPAERGEGEIMDLLFRAAWDSEGGGKDGRPYEDASPCERAYMASGVVYAYNLFERAGLFASPSTPARSVQGEREEGELYRSALKAIRGDDGACARWLAAHAIDSQSAGDLARQEYERGGGPVGTLQARCAELLDRAIAYRTVALVALAPRGGAACDRCKHPAHPGSWCAECATASRACSPRLASPAPSAPEGEPCA